MLIILENIILTKVLIMKIQNDIILSCLIKKNHKNIMFNITFLLF